MIDMVFYALATQRHLLDTLFQQNPTSSLSVETVVVGRVTVDDSNEAPQVIARVAVPVIEIQSRWLFVGVPERFVVNEVMSAV
jgi:hypothetical protein